MLAFVLGACVTCFCGCFVICCLCLGLPLVAVIDLQDVYLLWFVGGLLGVGSLLIIVTFPLECYVVLVVSRPVRCVFWWVVLLMTCLLVTLAGFVDGFVDDWCNSDFYFLILFFWLLLL